MSIWPPQQSRFDRTCHSGLKLLHSDFWRPSLRAHQLFTSRGRTPNGLVKPVSFFILAQTPPYSNDCELISTRASGKCRGTRGPGIRLVWTAGIEPASTDSHSAVLAVKLRPQLRTYETDGNRTHRSTTFNSRAHSPETVPCRRSEPPVIQALLQPALIATSPLS